MNDKSLSGLLGFLDWLATKGLMQRNTVAGRKAACSKVLGVLDPEEQADVTQVDVDEAMDRFANLEGRNYVPASLGVYRSRLLASLSDFERYLANPASFKPGLVQRRSKSGGAKKHQQPVTAEAPVRAAAHVDTPISSTHSPVNVFPIPIRPDVVVRIQGLPFDLTDVEARKIASVILALAGASPQ
jgi:hypothetical protein